MTAFDTPVLVAMPVGKPFVFSFMLRQAAIRAEPRTPFRNRSLALSTFRIYSNCHRPCHTEMRPYGSPRRPNVSTYWENVPKSVRSPCK